MSFRLDPSDTRALPVQIAEALRAHVAAGILLPGEHVPSTRSLARDLDISRGSVVTAYEQLTAEGYLTAAVGSGTVINPHDILIDNVDVAQTGGHGIIVGIGPLNPANPFVFNPRSERFLIRNCSVHHAVNFNQPQPQWGSSVKLHNVRHGKVLNCVVHDNSGEGVDVDYGQYIEISGNTIYDNYANIYLDKAENIIIRNLKTKRGHGGIVIGSTIKGGVRNVSAYNCEFDGTDTGIRIK